MTSSKIDMTSTIVQCSPSKPCFPRCQGAYASNYKLPLKRTGGLQPWSFSEGGNIRQPHHMTIYGYDAEPNPALCARADVQLTLEEPVNCRQRIKPEPSTPEGQDNFQMYTITGASKSPVFGARYCKEVVPSKDAHKPETLADSLNRVTKYSGQTELRILTFRMSDGIRKDQLWVLVERDSGVGEIDPFDHGVYMFCLESWKRLSTIPSNRIWWTNLEELRTRSTARAHMFVQSCLKTGIWAARVKKDHKLVEALERLHSEQYPWFDSSIFKKPAVDVRLQLQGFEKLSLDALVDEARCPICLTDYFEGEKDGILAPSENDQDSEPVVKHPCGHSTHLACIVNWVEHSLAREENPNASCPLCRGPFDIQDPHRNWPVLAERYPDSHQSWMQMTDQGFDEPLRGIAVSREPEKAIAHLDKIITAAREMAPGTSRSLGPRGWDRAHEEPQFEVTFPVPRYSPANYHETDVLRQSCIDVINEIWHNWEPCILDNICDRFVIKLGVALEKERPRGFDTSVMVPLDWQHFETDVLTRLTNFYRPKNADEEARGTGNYFGQYGVMPKQNETLPPPMIAQLLRDDLHGYEPEEAMEIIERIFNGWASELYGFNGREDLLEDEAEEGDGLVWSVIDSLFPSED